MPATDSEIRSADVLTTLKHLQSELPQDPRKAKYRELLLQEMRAVPSQALPNPNRLPALTDRLEGRSDGMQIITWAASMAGWGGPHIPKVRTFLTKVADGHFDRMRPSRASAPYAAELL